MSEYKKQIVSGSLIAVIIALVLAGGASYLFPLQSTQGAFSSTNKSTEFTTTAIATSTSYITSGIPTTTTGTTTVPFDTTSVTESSPTTMITTTSPVGTTITLTMTETAATATITLGQIISTTTKITEQIGITDAYAVSTTQITVTAVNFGYVDETLTDILVNGNPLSSVNGGVSNPSLPITIAPGASQIITLTFSSPLQSGTYFITINNKAG